MQEVPKEYKSRLGVLTEMAFTVVYDACVLYPASLGDLLLRLADLLTSLERTGLVRSVAEKRLGSDVIRRRGREGGRWRCVDRDVVICLGHDEMAHRC